MPDEPAINELVQLWQEARKKGVQLSPEQVCAGHPTLLDEVSRRIRASESDDAKLVFVEATAADSRTEPLPAADSDPPPDDGLTFETRFGKGRFHARGGLGIVYVAQDQSLHRDVALKFIRRLHAQDAESRMQFLREAEITAGLEHPGVVPVHGVGLDPDGTPFYTMRFIQGETLDAAIRRFHERNAGRRLFLDHAVEFRNLLGRFVSVCNTVAYAHNRGIIHRDIKPENVMLGKYGETLLVDWGLALPVGRDERARASGEVTLRPHSGSGSSSSGGGGGTPAYMSPEQAEMSPDVNAASDVYSLGATLYKLLCGEPAFVGRGGNLQTLLTKVRQGDFLPPNSVKLGVPEGLEAICLKAMALNPKDRYTTPLALAADVEHWLADEPVSARRETMSARLARWSRRHRTGIRAMVSALVLVLLVAIGSAVWLGRLAGSEREAREQGLRQSARFAARTVASEIDLRWRILEAEAADPELRAELMHANEHPNDPAVRQGLQAWLNKRYIKYQGDSRASAWFIDDRHGTLVALASRLGDRAAAYLGKNFADRDYFHGQPGTLTLEEGRKLGPTREVHLSTVFLSKTDQKLKVAFSVPVRAEKEGEMPLGVLALSVALGEFAELQTELSASQIAVLVDTRPDMIDKSEQRGLILHHRWMAEAQAEGQSPDTLLRRVSPEQVAHFQKLTAARLRSAAAPRTGAAEAVGLETLDRQYSDPVGGKYAGAWIAAAEPVLVNGRPEAIKNTGWVVIVQERK